MLDHLGYGDLQPELNQLSKQGRWDEMAGLVDEPLLDHIAIRGTPAEVGRGLVDRYAGLADRVGFYLPYGHDDSLIAAVMDEVAVRR